MSSSLSRVRARRAQIAQRLAAIGKETTDLRAEDDDLAVTERTLARLEGDAQPNLELVTVDKDPMANKFAGERPSIKQMIVRTLKQAPETWAPDAQWVWDAIRRDFNVEINKNSFYPQISSLVDHDKSVVRDGKKIALVERLSRRELREFTDREAAE
jgi:hypothetical protein